MTCSSGPEVGATQHLLYWLSRGGFLNAGFTFDVSFSVLLSIRLYFVSEADLKRLMRQLSCVKRLFPIRTIVINLHSCDYSAMFYVRLSEEMCS